MILHYRLGELNAYLIMKIKKNVFNLLGNGIINIDIR
jgi:hypothetical protein